MRAHLDVFNDACFLIFDNLLLEINQVRCCHIGDQLRLLKVPFICKGLILRNVS